MVIDLRSDTLMRPGKEMLAYMMSAPVGDDVFGEDPSVNRLEAMAAELFSMEAAVFCPSGTMSNQIGIKMHTQPGDEIICERGAHIFQYEGGGLASNSGVQASTIEGKFGRINAAQIEPLINNPGDYHKARTRIIALENTTNRGGGACYETGDLKEIRKLADRHGLKLHLDGARLFNAIIAKNQPPTTFGEIFDSISICLNKGLGCPAGSLLLGNSEDIKKARRIRKVLGGGMRQAGYLAACGIFALENNIERLAIDHQNAKAFGNMLRKMSFVKEVLPVETNIVIAVINDSATMPELLASFEALQIRSIAMSPRHIRFVFHLDISGEMMNLLTERMTNHRLA